MKLNGFRAWVSIDNVALDHYNAEISPDHTSVTCWIPSEVGKHFVVNWTDTSYARQMTHTAGRVIVDGQDAGGKVSRPSDRLSIASISGVMTSPTTSRPFTFWPLDLTADDSYLDAASGQPLGDITLHIWSVIPGPPYHASGNPVPLPLKVHERSKMGVGHCIRLGPEIYTGPISRTQCEIVSHLATFTFKYRSLDILRADGIIPPEPQPRAGEKRRAAEAPECAIQREPERVAAVDDAETDAEELKALQDKINAIHARQAMAKNGTKRVKIE